MIRPSRPAEDPAEPVVPTAAAKLSSAPNRLGFRLHELAAGLGVSRRSIERERAAGRFPRPDLTIGKMPLWTLETIRAWIERGGRP